MSFHLSDEELLLFLDRELPAARRAQAAAHLAECPACLHRRLAFEQTLQAFAAMQAEGTPTGSAAHGLARSGLQARLAAMRGKAPQPAKIAQKLALAAMALLVVAGGALSLGPLLQQRRLAQAEQRQAPPPLALPRQALTPGAVRDVRLQDVCTEATQDNDPPVDPSLEQAVFREYGVSDTSKQDFALDYLIAPALGGTQDITNLWPQPASSPWNAGQKDQLENQLRTLVCQHKLDLATAQRAMASDWIAAYRHYVPVAQKATAASGLS